MLNRAFLSFTACVTRLIVACCLLSPASASLAQPAPGVGSSRPESEYSRHPLKVKLSGFLNTRPEEGSLALIHLGIAAYQETYQFEVVTLEAVDRERVTPEALLRPTKNREIAYQLTGSRELLSKVAQSQPGTPLTIVGFLRQREGEIQLLSVDVVGFEENAE
jgi:hypothetical protein